MAADPKTSKGARDERRAVLAHVRRLINVMDDDAPIAELMHLEMWLLKRQARYDKKPGGLGK